MTGKGFQKPSGLGVSKTEVLKSVEEIKEFLEQKGSHVSGQARTFHKTADEALTVELIGNEANLFSVGAVAVMVESDPISMVHATALLLRLLQICIPQWKDSDKWLETAAQKAARQPYKIEKQGKTITLSIPSPGVFLLGIES
jgi:hypothetical protein